MISACQSRAACSSIKGGRSFCASAHIPMTHREAARTMAIVTGSQCENKESTVRWNHLAHGVDTLVIYMGVSQLKNIVIQLMKHGKPASTPIALIENGTMPHERVITGTLENIPKLAGTMKVSNPSVIVIGEVDVFYHIG